MAIRPVFLTLEREPFYQVWNCEFVYNSGFAPVQKQKNITAIHKAYTERFEGKKILEISSKSLQSEGVELSAFNLKKYVPELDKCVPVECVYQGGKCFDKGGPYTDLYLVGPRDAKRDERLSGAIVGFWFDGVRYPSQPLNAFYDFIYINACLENADLMEKLLEYDAFTDIEFSPSKSVNCQARAAAILVSLARADRLDVARDFDKFSALFGITPSSVVKSSVSVRDEKPVEEKKPEVVFDVGDTVIHKLFGRGEVTAVNGTALTIEFPSGVKLLQALWVSENCKVEKK